VYDLVMQLDHRDGGVNEPKEPDQRREIGFRSATFNQRRLNPASKENDYRRQAVEAVRLAQQASSSFAKARLVNLAEAWIELADRAHKARRLFRS
jgi:hypothetical protein